MNNNNNNDNNNTSYCMCVWCDSGELGRKRSSSSSVTTVVEISEDRVPKHQRRSSPAKTANALSTLTVPAKGFHHRTLIGF